MAGALKEMMNERNIEEENRCRTHASDTDTDTDHTPAPHLDHLDHRH